MRPGLNETIGPSWATRVRGVRVALTPRIATEWREARRHNLSVTGWRAAQDADLHLLPSLTAIHNGLVLDIGANIGDWTAAVLATEPSVTIVAVEPGDGPRAALQRRFAGDHRVSIDARAVADTAGTRRFHLTQHSHNASLRAPRPEMDDLYHGGGWRATDVVDVDVTTVDALASGRDVALLKIDVQGAEREVLAGAADTLGRTHAVLLEVTFVSHYEGDAGFPWLHEYMTSHGFELANLSKMFTSRRGTALWCDACYVRVA